MATGGRQGEEGEEYAKGNINKEIGFEREEKKKEEFEEVTVDRRSWWLRPRVLPRREWSLTATAAAKILYPHI